MDLLTILSVIDGKILLVVIVAAVLYVGRLIITSPAQEDTRYDD